MNRPVTLITGTRKGIGLALAKHYSEIDHIVVGCSRQGSEFSHKNYFDFKVDVTKESEVIEMFRRIKSEWGGVDNLINNAGIALMNHSMLTPMSAVEKIFSTNFLGTFLFCREAGRLMQKKKSGRIVNFSTVAVPLNLDGEAIYASSKAAVEKLTQILAREYSRFGVTVNAIGPTPIDTDLIRNVPDDKLKALTARQAIGRLGKFDDVINVLDFYLRPESEFITGQILYLGGV